MKSHSSARYVLIVIILCSLVVQIACSAKNSDITQPPLPTNNQVPASPTPTPQPFADLKEWDLLILSNSSNWGVGQYYAKLIEADMHVKVNLHDCWVGSLSIFQILQALQKGQSLDPYTRDKYCKQPWSDIVKEAEVMVLFGGPENSDPPIGAGTCVEGGYAYKDKLPDFEAYKNSLLASCAPEKWTTYKTHLGLVINEIYKLREGRPLILRMTDLYIPVHSSWVKFGMDEVCTACLVALSEAVRQVATEHGVPVADTMNGFNGDDHLSDPVDLGYIMNDGIHPSDKGAQYLAAVLQQTGYAYAKDPAIK